ncbi:putative U5 snRNP component [Taphrina deformans PYCC 5710]|uniref:Elongation factor 2 n=1 Tax=Taphrina deformans (strain PYCC 5710 / ATCC 11124 / CBS 356.35 / IMI 108563 / JCM 9778 / NBRC 8474) TaxID=1097556 RepID=R4X8I5_TAPDE|nr:putative U5 snRNP component [Taphrina deformans PYCC 5710]|eukprot:CCG81924.1 putative U5 snRNP component [Taphrina deformans PYCC 5710]
MDEDLYDEFGNYIGEDLDSDDDKDVGGETSGAEEYNTNLQEPIGHELMQIDDDASIVLENQIVLHEDKRYYPSATQVYGEDVETLVQEEDTQPLSEPIVKPVSTARYTLEEDELPQVRFDRTFMLQTMAAPEFIRNIAVVGHLHHGKTTLMDMLVKQSHIGIQTPEKEQLRYTDTHVLERERGISIKATPITLMLPNTKGKSLVCNLIDTPGHVNFIDEVASAMRLADGILLVVDAAEGFMPHTEKILRHALTEDLSIALVITKVDRLILELKLPPTDAYFKLKHIVEEVNNAIFSIRRSPEHRLSPERGNVCFASADMGWCFSLQTFAKFYADQYKGIMLEDFAKRLWGDIYFSPSTNRFVRKPTESSTKRSFVHFILEPIYKLYAQALSSDHATLSRTLRELGIVLKPAAYKLDARPLLNTICGEFFGPATGLVDLIFSHVKSPVDHATSKVERTYTGALDGSIAQAMKNLDPEGPLIVQVTKLLTSPSAKSFSALGRIFSGTLRRGDTVRVLGENYSPEDEEDMAFAQVSQINVPGARYRVGVEEMGPGSLVLIDGVDTAISKTATLVAKTTAEDASIFRPVQHLTESVMKIAVEPVNPSELPKMLEGLRQVNKSYPLAQTKVEESGEHVLLGVGELYMDCMLHDLRKLYSEVDIKVSDPVTRFCETIIDTSAIKCYADTPNKKNKITMIAEPLDDGIAEDIEHGRVSIKMSSKEVGQHFQERYHWDLLASRSIWAFGPDDNGPNILQDDTLPDEVDKKTLKLVRESLRQGFQWGTREGPLCDEPIRNTKFKILDAVLASETIYRGGGQIIPTARRVCYSSFLMASPRLMEPVYQVTITVPADCIPAIYNVLSRRRGHVTKEIPIAGSPLYYMTALIPVIDSFGFETDLRSHTQGQAFCQQDFDHWQVVPGDPLDKEIKLKALQSASAQHMARDFMIKTRRRKGLNEDVSVRKYIEEEMSALLESNGMIV